MGRYQAYPEYKSAECKWLDEIPSTWSLSPLKALVKIVNGSTPKSDVEDYWDGDVSWITPADMGKRNSPFIDYGARNITVKGYESCGTSMVPAGSIVLSSRAPIGTLAIAQNELCTNQGCKSLVVTTKVNSKFVYYSLHSSTKQLNVLGRGTTFLELSSDELARFVLPTPSICEQQAIANFLDHETAKIDTLIEQQQLLIQLLKEKRQAVISHAVTKGLNPDAPMKDSGVEWLGEVPAHWKLCPLKYAIELQRGHDLPSDSRVEGNVPVVSSGGVIAYHNEIKALGPGIVTGRYGTIGEFYLEERDYWPLNTSLYSVNTFNNYVKYLWYMLQSLKHLFVLNSMKSAVPGVDRNDLNPEVIALPHDIIEQKQIVDYLDAKLLHFDNVEREALSAIQLMQERRTALISAAVTGKIDVRNWQASQQ